jgi:tetratricopeptide (TPR) repeat protein
MGRGYTCDALGGGHLRPRRRVIFPALVLVVCAIITHQRVSVWYSERTLWADAVAKTPNKPRPVMDYGRALEMDGDLDGALNQFMAVIPLTLDDRRGTRANRFAMAAAETNIAHIYLRTGREASALKVLSGTLSWWPEFPYAHYNIGRLLWAHGACADGLTEIAYARAQDPLLALPGDPCGRQ